MGTSTGVETTYANRAHFTGSADSEAANFIVNNLVNWKASQYLAAG